MKTIYSVHFAISCIWSFGRVYYSIANRNKTGIKNVFPFFSAIVFVAICFAQAVYALSFWKDIDYVITLIVLCQTIVIYVIILYKSIIYARKVEINAIYCSSKFEKINKRSWVSRRTIRIPKILL